MYRSLVTNLPKEIMAYLDTPFDPSLPVSSPLGRREERGTYDCRFIAFQLEITCTYTCTWAHTQSFLGHAQVQAYLESYANAHRLTELVAFEAEVKAVRPVFPASVGQGRDYSVWQDGEEEGQEPRWRVTYRQNQQQHAQGEQEEEEELFDAVVVCNGHFDVSYSPPFPGLREHFRGRVLHSRNYDDPSVCAGLRVLCVGYKSSGTDIARCAGVVCDAIACRAI